MLFQKTLQSLLPIPGGKILHLAKHIRENNCKDRDHLAGRKTVSLKKFLLKSLFALLIPILITGSSVSAKGVATTLNSISGPPGWYLISFPFTSIDRIDGLKGDLLNKEGGKYSKAPLQSLIPGRAYWLHSMTPLKLTVSGDLNESPSKTIHLQPGWNTIGNPYPDYVEWSSAQVFYSGKREDISRASARGWLSSTILGFDPVSSQYHKVIPGNSLEPWKGYLIKSSVSCDLIIRNSSKARMVGTIKITVEPSRIPADETSTGQVKIQAIDSAGNPAPRQMIELSITSGTITPDKLATDSNGEGVAHVSSCKEGEARITAQSGNIITSSSVSFIYSSAGAGRFEGKKLKPLGTLPADIAGALAAIAQDDGTGRIYNFGGYAPSGIMFCWHTADGINITQVEQSDTEIVEEEGEVTSPSVVRLDDGRYRMYYDGKRRVGAKQISRIYSSVSDDGIHWEREGFCFKTNHESDFAGTPSVIKTSEGLYRLYFSLARGAVGSAHSEDGIEWEEDEGERISGADADVKLLPDGTYFMVYRYADNFPAEEGGIACATSLDGLTWKPLGPIAVSEVKGGVCCDPFILLFPNGKMKIYYMRAIKSGGAHDPMDRVMIGEF